MRGGATVAVTRQPVNIVNTKRTQRGKDQQDIAHLKRKHRREQDEHDAREVHVYQHLFKDRDSETHASMCIDLRTRRKDVLSDVAMEANK